jgi:DNA-binding transcriptional ArsR family regulator
MKTYPDIATVAALIGEPARAAMLVELMSGQAMTASELAARVDIAPSTASDHLGKLTHGALLSCEQRGRYRYYRLASLGVAQALEALGTLACPVQPEDDFEMAILDDLRFARSCYDHVAGRLGVAFTESLVARQLLREDGLEYQLTPTGEDWFTVFGVDIAAARQRRRAFARRCLDWSERRSHLAGSLGAGLLEQLLKRGWVERMDGERTLQLTQAGEAGLASEFAVQLFPDRGIACQQGKPIANSR